MDARASRGIRNLRIGITSKSVSPLFERRKKTQVVSTAGSFQVAVLPFTIENRVVAAGYPCLEVWNDRLICGVFFSLPQYLLSRSLAVETSSLRKIIGKGLNTVEWMGL